jgi:hypothetical protein
MQSIEIDPELNRVALAEAAQQYPAIYAAAAEAQGRRNCCRHRFNGAATE